MKLHIKKEILVKAIVGVDKGKDPAKVLTVDAKKLRAIVEGYNIVTKHLNLRLQQSRWWFSENRSIDPFESI